MRERPTPEEFKGGDEPHPRGVRGFIEKLSPRKKMMEEREKEQHFIREFERGDLRVQKHYISEEEAHKDIREISDIGLVNREISDIKLINKKGESYSLKDELPRKGKFIEVAGLGTAEEILTQKNGVWFPEAYIDVVPRKKETTIGSEWVEKDFLKEKEGAFLSVYHEIAHLRRRSRLFKSLSLKKRFEELKRFELIAASRHRMLSKKDKERYEELVLGEERLCWAFALRKIRELRKKGFNVEPTFDSPLKLKEFLHFWLHSYEYEKPLSESAISTESPQPVQELLEKIQGKAKSVEELLEKKIDKKLKKS